MKFLLITLMSLPSTRKEKVATNYLRGGLPSSAHHKQSPSVWDCKLS